MNMKLTKGLLGLGAMLIASQVSAATISLTPAVVDVSVGDTVSLTAGGTGFDTGVSSGTLFVTWDATALQLETTAQQIQIDLVVNGFGFSDIPNLATPGTIALDFISTGFTATLPGPDFTLFNLDFTVIPPPSSGPVSIGANAIFGTWQDAAGLDINPVNYVGAQVNVNAVPVPAAAWLFGSGLIGLVGIARRKTQLA